ncbi:MAG: hypothetical protein HY291_02760 [Planctomycetes bacterium]|nr:hypothetical protein [Planctomycetota bacterium]
MNTRLKRSHAGSLLMVALAWAAGGFAGEERDIPIRPWTLSEALAVLELQPDDVYLQFAALQLGRREGKGKETEEKVRAIVSPFRWWAANERREDLDLFNLFTGALAVQESLQFDTLRSAGAEEAKEKKDEVKLSKLKGPEIKSHPWTKMLNGRKPEVSALSRCVPSDFFLAEFRSVNKLLDAQEVSDLWGAHFFNQAEREAHSFALGPRIRRQLVLETSLLLRPVYDMVVEEVALTGSDLFLREGSDLTLLFKIAQPELFKARMDGFMANARQAHPEGVFEKGEYNGVAYEHFTAEGRERDVYAAYPEAGVHIRSNSLPAFQRVVDAVLGKGPDGKKAERLGDMEEFAFIRTLMPRGAKEEDGFVYLSDPFIREQVGPRVKLTERRRILCYNRLRMIGHAALLFRTEHGRAPASLDEVIEKDCLPRGFGKGESACLDGGVYGLSTDGAFGTCSCHGHARFLTPCGEIEIKKVTKDEAEQYERFIKDYEQYWRMYFDPIALRVQITPQRYRPPCGPSSRKVSARASPCTSATPCRPSTSTSQN